ncbi:hypothetical protein AVEN_214126-1 [Araneus ventricosus]|uniref:Uncharacterized protein n=1 Tax=Araneus ventricosus TaxID=182803 RepID=A0A4Y2C8S2_ARAVE|nr:hypothetical protein AVEN_214126-1 [Araneus ventricosus]
MKRALPEASISAGAAKRPSVLSNTDSFTSDSIPPHYYHLGEENYAVTWVEGSDDGGGVGGGRVVGGGFVGGEAGGGCGVGDGG